MSTFFLIVEVDILITVFLLGEKKQRANKQKLISPKSPKMHAIHLTKRKRALALRGKNLFHFSPATHKLLWGRTGGVDSKEVCCIELYWTKALNWLVFATQQHLTHVITLGKNMRQYCCSVTVLCYCGCWFDESVVIQTEVEEALFIFYR